MFRDDGASYVAALKGIEFREADRRLAAKLTNGARGIHSMSRFELAGTVQAEVLARVPAEPPWREVVSPEEVARVLESYLVEEVPANPPDYRRLKELDADSVLEVVVEEFGMKSAKGRAGLWMLGHARMFTIDGPVFYWRRFRIDELSAEVPHLDPFAVAKNPTLYVERMRGLLRSVATAIAGDLTVPSPAGAVEPRREGSGDAGDGTVPRRIRRTPTPDDDPL